MAFDRENGTGTLSGDFLDISIDQMGRDVYNDATPDVKFQMKKYHDDMAAAIKMYLQRQTFNITNMDAPVVIPSMNPWLPVSPPQTILPQFPVPAPGFVIAPGTPISLSSPLYGRSQISEDENSIGYPSVRQNVKSSAVKLLEPED